MAAAPLDVEHAHLVARDRQVDVAPVAFWHALPRYNDALPEQRAHAVLVGAEFRHTAGSFEFSLVVVLLGEREEMTFAKTRGLLVWKDPKQNTNYDVLPLVLLERGHGLLDVIIVALSLLFEVFGFLVKIAERQSYAFELSLSLDTAPTLGSDIQRNCV